MLHAITKRLEVYIDINIGISEVANQIIIRGYLLLESLDFRNNFFTLIFPNKRGGGPPVLKKIEIRQ